MTKRVSRRTREARAAKASIEEQTVTDLPRTPELLLLPPQAQTRVELIRNSIENAKATDPKERFRVTIMKDHHLIYPDLWLDVYIAGDSYEQAMFAEMFARAACKKAKSVDEADLVVFTGGPDVDPQLYGVEPHPKTHCHPARDTLDIQTYQECLSKGVPMFGVCRGAQFLHVMNGGKLYQDVDNHNGDHTMWDIKAMKTIEKVSSVHHQMCIDNAAGGMELLGTSSVARNHVRSPGNVERGTIAGVEAFFYRDTCCLGVQGHPEYRGYNAFAKWCLERLNEFVILNPDIDWKNTKRRLKDEILAQRGLLTSIIPAAAQAGAN